MIYESYPFIAPERFTGKLQGKVVLVTGASAGIGRYICKAFAAAGASVACVARREGDLNKLVDEIKASGGNAVSVVGDVSKRGAPKEIVSNVESALGPVDILINNAGITRIGPVVAEDDGMDIWWRVYEINVRAPVAMVRAVLPGMLHRKSGMLISTSSSVATLNLPTMSAYNSSKAAISKFHEGITAELEGSGILSFAVHPGQVETELGAADNAINQAAMDHFAVKKFIGMVSDPNAKRQTPDLPANTMVALAAEPRCQVLHGRHVNSDQDLEAVLKEAEKDGMGEIGARDLYVVRIGQL